jgi:signal peptidase I
LKTGKREKEQPSTSADSKEEILTRKERIRREVVAWTWVVVIFLLINGTLGQARVIPSGSMEKTLLIGDHLIMSRVGYDAGVPFTNWHVPLWRNPRRQQIVIFRSIVPPDAQDIIKRVIGLPGETVDIHDGAVWINGQKLQENYTTGPTERYETPMPYKVPENCYFVLGDNRGNSYDSRYEGCIPRNKIIGVPVIIYMSVEASGDAWESGGLGARFLTYAKAVIHPGTVRWKRLFNTF